MAKKLTSTKARKILHDKEVHGQPLTDKQRKFFGAIAGGAEPYKAQIGTMLTSLPSNMMDRLSDALGFPQKAVTKLVTGKYQTPSEAMNIQSPAGAIAADVLLDPLTFIGGGAGASKAAKAVKASTKTGLLSRAHEYNPWAFKPQEGVMMYRGIGEEGMKDALESGLIRSKQNTGIVKEKNFTISKQFGNPYFSPSFETANRYGQGYIAEVPISAANWRRRYGNPNKTWSQIASREIPITEGRILKKDWLRGYKEVKPPKKKQDGGWLDKYDEGGVLKQKKEDNYGVQGNYNDYSVSTPPGFKGWAYNLKGRNYSPAWGGQFQDGGVLQPPMAGAPQAMPLMQMGGSLPGAVGFMYARTVNPAPSNGPYAKKTKASAQNGQEMKYYQAGLDFKPKTISQDGSDIPVDPMGYWNPENVGEPVIIPSNIITMEGVDQPLLGISDTGDVQYMEPGEDYEFDGEYVTEYPVAQKGKRVPIVVSDPKDPRLKAYKDSLSLYNKFKNAKTDYKNLIISKGFDPSYIEEWTTNGYVDKDVHPKIGAVRYGILQNSGGGFDRDNNYNPRGFNNYPTMSGKQLTVYEDTNLGKAIGTRYPVYKKPVQPVEYRAPQRDTIYVPDINDPRLKAYQDSLSLYKGYRNYDLDKTKPIEFYDKNDVATLRAMYPNTELIERKPRPLSSYDQWVLTESGRKTNFKVGKTYSNKELALEQNKAEQYANRQGRGLMKNKGNLILDWKNQAVRSSTIAPIGMGYGDMKDIDNSNAGLVTIYKKPVQPVVYKKPEPKQEVVKKPEPVVEKKAPLTDYFQGTPVYAPTPYHGSGAGAFVGYKTPQGDTVFVKPEDYERMGVPKYGREFIESKTKKMKNGGVSVNNADAQPLKKLDQSLNFTNYNKPTKGGWLDKYN